MKKLILGLFITSAVVFAFAVGGNNGTKTDSCCPGKETKAVQVKASGACADQKAVQVKMAKQDCGACPGEAKMAKQDCGACPGEAKMASKGGDQCCKSSAGKTMMKGDKGCCNAAGALAKFKVFADGKWFFYGCKESANMGRQQLLPIAFKVGNVQPVTGKVAIPARQSLI